MRVRRVFSICFLLMCILAVQANLVVTSFRYNPSDATANTKNTEKYDQNGERCALIKVETTQTGFHFDVGTLGVTHTEQHPGEIWVYVPHSVKRITIQHAQLGVLRDWVFPEQIRSSFTYIMKLSTGSVETIVHESAQKQYLLFRVVPGDAMVTVTPPNGEETTWFVQEGETSRLLNFGKYQYRVSANLYHTEVGIVEVNDAENTQVVNINLKPNHGWLKIATSNDLQDAQVYIDNKQCGKIPFQSERIPSGEHSLLIAKPMYRNYTQQFTVKDNETLTLAPKLVANFAELVLKVENNAEIWVNGKKYANGQWSGNLEIGEYIIETKLASHRPKSKSLTVTNEMRHQTIVLPAPSPIYGSLQVETKPYGASIYMDDKLVGQTPKYISNVLVGDHTIVLKKEKYVDLTKKVAIAEDQTAKVEGKMEEKKAEIENGHEWIDLGLSVKWATCNVGASKPEEYGDYFAWGETGAKSNNDWISYKYCKGSETTMTKYCVSSKYGTVDNKTTLEAADDAAHVSWGGNWRMPTHAEQEELVNNCTVTWTTNYNGIGVAGRIFTSKKTGYTDKSIFLPAAGYRLDTDLNNAGSYGLYWSSSLYEYYSNRAWLLFFTSDNVRTYYYDRRCGQSVRAVCP